MVSHVQLAFPFDGALDCPVSRRPTPQRRATEMERSGTVLLEPAPEYPAIVLVVDEWAELAADGSSKQRDEANRLLRRFVSLGRATGCSAVLATQRPTSETIDTGTRALGSR
ncbi:MAG: hypothetical protein O2986_06035 [Actinomycetota bacterium]|nr:hypothetical protein [Actinomycetota bacterium]